jgi:transcriptional/translational regulatory protein YebC/TACO1
MVPTSTIEITDDNDAKRVLRLMDAIDDHDDVQAVHSNFDVPESVLAAYEG